MRYRRAIQWGILALLALMPVLNILRVDSEVRGVIFFGRPVYLNSAYILILPLTAIITSFAGSARLFGKLFCGWACPHNTLSEVAEALLRRWRRGGRLPPVRQAAFYGLVAFGAAAGAFALASYLVGPAALARIVARGDLLGDAATWLFLAAVFGFLFAYVGLVRHQVCRLYCPLGMVQNWVRTDGSLQVGIDQVRTAECIDCLRCSRACPVGLDPRQPEPYLCTNCGKCILACEAVSRRRRVRNLLGFTFGPNSPDGKRRGLPVPLAAALGTTVVLLAVATAWGVLAQAPVYLAVFRNERGYGLVQSDGQVRSEYHVDVRNQTGRAVDLALRVRGLPAGWRAAFSENPLILAPGEQKRVRLTVETAGRFRPGIHNLTVEVVDGGRTLKTVPAVFFATREAGGVR